jgi:hypothetical protein
MPSIRKKYNAPVAYYVHANNVGVHVSNKYTAKLIFELLVINAKGNDIIEMKAILPPTMWPSWSRTHIISLLNGCWHASLIGRYVYKNNKLVEVTDYSRNSYKTDHYERHAEFMHDALSYGEKQTLNYILSTPELFKLIVQSPTAASAKVAMKYLNKIDKTNNVPLSHVVTCWKFLRLQHERQRKNNTS